MSRLPEPNGGVPLVTSAGPSAMPSSAAPAESSSSTNSPHQPASISRKTIVIKLGTSSIISPHPPYLPHLALLSLLTQTVHSLRQHGHRVILVSSGAIGVGMRTLAQHHQPPYHQPGSSSAAGSHPSSGATGSGATSHPSSAVEKEKRTLQRKQALAAIGQGRLIALWDNLFGMLDVPVAQVLLTRADISDRQRYLNAQNTLAELLSLGAVPIVNENDTVSVSEIKFGDNDTLSAITASMVQADYLFLMTDVECLYTDNPRKNPEARPVRVVRDLQRIKNEVSTATLGTALGTGGMSTKLIAAELAMAAGVTTVILHSSNVTSVFEIIAADEEEMQEGDEWGPICTRFIPPTSRMADRKWWIAHGLHAAGEVVIDEGAWRAIRRRESGGRLLPAGVLSVSGTFASHQAVRLVVRRRRRPRSSTITAGASAGDGDDGAATPSTSIPPSSTVASPALDRAQASPFTQPQTPNINPALSLSSSVTSLEGLSLAAALGGTANGGSASSISASTLQKLVQESDAALAEASGRSSLDTEPPNEGRTGADEWEDAEIGKGLALYNSVEIDRIKGHKRSERASLRTRVEC